MQKKIKVLLISLFFISCNSQNEMDLAELNLPVKSTILLNDKIDTTEDSFYPGYTIYKSKDQNVLIFNHEKLSGSLSNGEGPDTNYLRFYVNDENMNIPLIALRSFVSEKTQMLHTSLLDKFGKPDYYKSISFASYSVWENKDTQNIYLFEHNYGGTSNGLPTEEGILFIIDMKNKVLLEHHTKATYSYYMDYLKERKTKAETYTYKQFATEKNEDGTTLYLKAIENPVEH